mgnify:CR=1 FL=1
MRINSWVCFIYMQHCCSYTFIKIQISGSVAVMVTCLISSADSRDGLNKIISESQHPIVSLDVDCGPTECYQQTNCQSRQLFAQHSTMSVPGRGNAFQQLIPLVDLISGAGRCSGLSSTAYSNSLFNNYNPLWRCLYTGSDINGI